MFEDYQTNLLPELSAEEIGWIKSYPEPLELSAIVTAKAQDRPIQSAAKGVAPQQTPTQTQAKTQVRSAR